MRWRSDKSSQDAESDQPDGPKKAGIWSDPQFTDLKRVQPAAGNVAPNSKYSGSMPVNVR